MFTISAATINDMQQTPDQLRVANESNPIYRYAKINSTARNGGIKKFTRFLRPRSDSMKSSTAIVYRASVD